MRLILLNIINKIFLAFSLSLRYYIEIGGVIGLNRAIMSPLCTVFIFLFETYVAVPEEGQSPAESSSGLLNVIETILSLFETEEPYKN
jgi:hypothetical protein